jgi:hypothetical protein
MDGVTLHHIIILKNVGQAKIPQAIFWASFGEIWLKSILGRPVFFLASTFVLEYGLLRCRLNFVTRLSSHHRICVFTNCLLQYNVHPTKPKIKNETYPEAEFPSIFTRNGPSRCPKDFCLPHECPLI